MVRRGEARSGNVDKTNGESGGEESVRAGEEKAMRCVGMKFLQT